MHAYCCRRLASGLYSLVETPQLVRGILYLCPALCSRPSVQDDRCHRGEKLTNAKTSPHMILHCVIVLRYNKFLYCCLYLTRGTLLLSSVQCAMRLLPCRVSPHPRLSFSSTRSVRSIKKGSQSSAGSLHNRAPLQLRNSLVVPSST